MRFLVLGAATLIPSVSASCVELKSNNGGKISACTNLAPSMRFMNSPDFGNTDSCEYIFATKKIVANRVVEKLGIARSDSGLDGPDCVNKNSLGGNAVQEVKAHLRYIQGKVLISCESRDGKAEWGVYMEPISGEFMKSMITRVDVLSNDLGENEAVIPDVLPDGSHIHFDTMKATAACVYVREVRQFVDSQISDAGIKTDGGDACQAQSAWTFCESNGVMKTKISVQGDGCTISFAKGFVEYEAIRAVARPDQVPEQLKCLQHMPRDIEVADDYSKVKVELVSRGNTEKSFTARLVCPKGDYEELIRPAHETAFSKIISEAGLMSGFMNLGSAALGTEKVKENVIDLQFPKRSGTYVFDKHEAIKLCSSLGSEIRRFEKEVIH